MHDFKDNHKKDCRGMRSMFRSIDKKEELYREAGLREHIPPEEAIRVVKLFTNDSRMCVGSHYLSFEFGIKRIEIDNTKLIIRSCGLPKEDWERLTRELSKYIDHEETKV